MRGASPLVCGIGEEERPLRVCEVPQYPFWVSPPPLPLHSVKSTSGLSSEPASALKGRVGGAPHWDTPREGGMQVQGPRRWA